MAANAKRRRYSGKRAIQVLSWPLAGASQGGIQHVSKASVRLRLGEQF